MDELGRLAIVRYAAMEAVLVHLMQLAEKDEPGYFTDLRFAWKEGAGRDADDEALASQINEHLAILVEKSRRLPSS